MYFLNIWMVVSIRLRQFVLDLKSIFEKGEKLVGENGGEKAVGKKRWGKNGGERIGGEKIFSGKILAGKQLVGKHLGGETS